MLDVELARETTAPRTARRLMVERFADELSDEELDTARLLVSELVTNAVVHGRQRADAEGRQLVLTHVPAHAQRLFRLTGISASLTVE